MNFSSATPAPLASPDLSGLGRQLSTAPHKYLSYLPLTRFAPNRPKNTPVFSITYEPLSPVSSSVTYHLQGNPRMLQKTPNVSYNLQTSFPVTTSVAYHLRKKGGGYAACRPKPQRSTAPLCNFFVPVHLESKLKMRPAAPLLTPLFSTLSAKPYTKSAPGNSIILKRFQPSRKSAPANSFRMIVFQKQAVSFVAPASLPANLNSKPPAAEGGATRTGSSLPPCFIGALCGRMRSLVLSTRRLS